MHRSCLEAKQKKMKRTGLRKDFSPYSSNEYFDAKSERFLENIPLQIWKPNKTTLRVNPDFVKSGDIKLETPNVENFSINTFEELHFERNLPILVSPDQGRLRPPKKVESIPLQTFVTQESPFSGEEMDCKVGLPTVLSGSQSRQKSLKFSPSEKLPMQVPSRSPLFVGEHPMDPSYSALMKVSFSPYFNMPQLQSLQSIESSVQVSEMHDGSSEPHLHPVAPFSQPQLHPVAPVPQGHLSLFSIAEEGPDSFIF
jgi:hypothetical protein